MTDAPRTRSSLESQTLATDLARVGVPHRPIVLDGITHGFEFQLGPTGLLPDVLTFLDEALNHKPITAP